MRPAGVNSSSQYDAGQALAALSKAAGNSTNPLVFSMAGRLHLAKSGWLLLSVPKALIDGARDAIERPGFEPPSNCGIPVMTPTEVESVGADKITERGHNYNYKLGSIESHEPSTGFYAVVLRWKVISPELRQLRLSYGLSAFPQNTDSFYLPLACRRSGVLTGSVIKKSYDDEIDWEIVKQACEGEELEAH